MRNILFDGLVSCVLGAAVLALTGCARTEASRFYQLSSLSGQHPAMGDVSPQGNVVVAIGPVRIPDFLDRPQVVTRSGRNELKISEFDRWAGSLENDCVLVLVENIGILLPSDRFFVTRWTPQREIQMAASYRVEVLIERFEGTPGGSVSLNAQWVLFGQDKRLLLKKESSIREQVNGVSYDALVSAMSKALERLSRDIADGITSKSGTGAV